MIQIVLLEKHLCSAMATILNTDMPLRRARSLGTAATSINGDAYYDRCRAWEARKHGQCYLIMRDSIPVGSISSAPAGGGTASVGYWVRSSCWNSGYGTCALLQMKAILQTAGYQCMTAKIPKDDLASKRIWEKCGAVFTEDDRWYFPHIAPEGDPWT